MYANTLTHRHTRIYLINIKISWRICTHIDVDNLLDCNTESLSNKCFYFLVSFVKLLRTKFGSTIVTILLQDCCTYANTDGIHYADLIKLFSCKWGFFPFTVSLKVSNASLEIASVPETSQNFRYIYIYVCTDMSNIYVDPERV